MEFISKLFCPSPLRYLHDHALRTGTCLRRLQSLVEGAFSEDTPTVDGTLTEIRSHVLIGRAIEDDAMQCLSTRLILPVCREDIIATFDAQRLVLSTCSEIASLISAGSLSVPDDTRQQLGNYVQEVLDLAMMATDIVARVDVLLEVSFGGPEAEKVASLIDELQVQKTKTDLLRNRCLQTLCSSHVGPCEHIFCWQLLTEIRHMATLTDKLTSRFRLFVVPPSGRPLAHELSIAKSAKAGRNELPGHRERRFARAAGRSA